VTIRTSLMIAAVIAITLAGVTERSFSSPAKAGQFQGVGVTEASTSQDVDRLPLDHPEMCPVDVRTTCARGQVRCGARCYDPNVSCCCSSKKGPQIVGKPKKRTTNSCYQFCEAAGLGAPAN
jgi:hypothetical protein